MTDQSPAALLRAAAEKLHALATAASTDTDGTPTANWHTEPCWPDDPTLGHHLYGDHLTRDDGSTISWPLLNRGGSPHRRSYMHGQHAEYAAAMNPAVGLAIAAWLDSAAEDAEQIGADPRALATARRILGEKS
ncbi:hypothetical protein ACFYOY_13570 [Streptomyces sp. NPDC007875]|uniref:hypothetical protein n=1 Tax=Streptomyces sp. NPDC007875 TaxID=3364783 RepID=UPI0036783907